jgi:hypothetical protein
MNRSGFHDCASHGGCSVTYLASVIDFNQRAN